MSNVMLKNLTSEVVSQILELMRDDVYKIYLYGSYARGDYDNESDVDIMIILNCDKEKVKQYRKQVSIIASRIGLINDVELSLTIRDRVSFEEGKEILPFYRNVEKEGVTIYE